ncbi:MAG: hypothetical protein ACREVK_12315 [Gammaproteobacteria bacterium]
MSTGKGRKAELRRLAAKHGVALALLIWFPGAHGATTSFVCNFSVSTSPSGLEKETPALEMRFVLDSKTNKTYLMGNNGSSEVHAILNSDGISFLEITESGNAMVTTISASGAAVHSRNSIFGPDLIPSQHYGSCVRL